MSVCETLKKRRSARSFTIKPVEKNTLLSILDIARLSPSAANLQSLKYAVICDEEKRLALFPYIRYAGYTPEWENNFKTTPKAFVAVLNDSKIRPADKSQCDAGIAMMAICAVAEEMGLGSCILGAIEREEIKKVLSIPDSLDLLYLVGLGYADRQNRLVTFDDGERVKYKLDETKSFLVPKRELSEIIIEV